jgi:hypothetical protein
MKSKRLSPHSPEVIDAAVEMVRKMKMTPDEALEFLTYRTPGVEETDMTGMLRRGPSVGGAVPAKRRVASK